MGGRALTVNWMGSELSVRVPAVLHPGNRGGPACVHHPRMVSDSVGSWLVSAARGCDEVWYSGAHVADESVVDVVPAVLAGLGGSSGPDVPPAAA